MNALFETGASGFGFLGLNTPVQRFTFMGVLGAAVEYGFKPSVSYNSDGSFRPWVAFSKSDNATYFPPGSIALLFGTVGGLFF